MKHTIEGVEYDTIESAFCSAYGVDCHFQHTKVCDFQLPNCDRSPSVIFLTPENYLKAITNRLLGVPVGADHP